GSRVDIDVDDVAFVDCRDRAAFKGFGRNVRDHEPVRRATEAAIGEQRHRVAEARTLHGRRYEQHFAHTWSAFRTFVANHHHIVGLDLAVVYRRESVFFALEHARRTHMLALVVAGEFDHARIRRERTPQDRQTTRGLQRLIKRQDYVLARSFDGLRRLFTERLARAGEHRSVDVLALGEPLRNNSDAARARSEEHTS